MFSEQKQTSFEANLKFGEEGEHEVAEWLRSRDNTVLPLYQFDAEEAPLLFTPSDSLISPDLLGFGRDAFLVEVKTKNQWVGFTGEPETGFNRRHFDHYRKVEECTGKKVWVFFNHKTEEPTGLFFCRLGAYSRMWDGRDPNGNRVQGGMVFYKRKDLFPVEQPAAVALPC